MQWDNRKMCSSHLFVRWRHGAHGPHVFTFSAQRYRRSWYLLICLHYIKNWINKCINRWWQANSLLFIPQTMLVYIPHYYYALWHVQYVKYYYYYMQAICLGEMKQNVFLITCHQSPVFIDNVCFSHNRMIYK